MARVNVKIDKFCQWESLPDGYNVVRIEYGHFPPGAAVVYLRRVTCEDKFWFFQTKVHEIGEEEYKKKINAKQKTVFTVGDYCLAVYEFDDRFYRVRIDMVDGDAVGVFYVDFGSFGIVHAEDVVYPPPSLFLEEPFQAIECNVASVRPVAIDDWTDEVCDFMDDLCGRDEYCLAKVVHKYDLALTTGGYCYDVVLLWGSNETPINLNKYMATIGGAPLPDEDQEVFAAVEMEMKSPGWQENPNCRFGRCYTGNSCPYQLPWPEVGSEDIDPMFVSWEEQANANADADYDDDVEWE